ncbi:4-alpha-glucanotransferase [Mycobacterium shimoidei]|uniref:4-alpha-glucanotransferase n=1 Tax=Mycobacterium shimoidei TaxID=29313 RepID=A0A1E3TB11_MYCSH|nr:4-alpha-glucanotransferase [Mycobacterium shimoidei]MCV7258997.1 4-alpha-glucanotransferase [Mycobacterium shimoidei]ODR11574.1 4-alpha-glucanotransferase [Mycobacterium shimoidei]ORW76795.1 4-alpha-glucanotransferase [Mycobacterium shimoidei]SRX95256.1 putative 4-alpha-glucanotransferase MalQ (amylomaltase) (disproportionating enzyme) (D-enzyme) [Mycobacterium tuberculosis H37Rv] [Mycobacterium shimoidei]
MTASLGELAGRFGIATEYEDWTGRRVVVPESTVVAVLAAFGVPARTESERAAALAAHERRYWARPLPVTIVARAGTETKFWVHVTDGHPAEVWLRLEDGTVHGGIRQIDNFTAPFDLDGRRVGEASFVLPADLPLGYHRVHLRSGQDEASTALIVTPDWLGLPERVGARRTWGLAAQLYSVRSERSWGVGDLTDLTDLAVWAASAHGAGYLLVNPLHAATPVEPMEPSPYLPSSRRFVNPLYLRVEAIDEFGYLRKRGRVWRLRDDVRKHAARIDTIDRDTAWAAKRKALRLVYRVPRSAGRELAYAAYRAREGAALDDFAAWCALAEKYGGDWHQWPRGLQHPAGEEVAEFVAKHAARVDFHRWLQWQLDEQLGAAQARAVAAGMALGIMHDLAVGVHPNGADAWALQDTLALGVTAGAPPDEFNQLGQDWSQPPWRPDRLEEQEYQPFRVLIRSVLRHAGGVRVDHIIGLFRLWWIPSGAPPTDGTYVRYDHEAMIGILALEAHRAEAVVVGEDLGTVQPWVRDYLRARGVLGTSILWFELDRDSDGGPTPRPLPAERWREYCLSSVTTHDLPPTAGYLADEHVRLRDSLGLLTRPVDTELAAAQAERAAWLAELRRAGLLGKHADLEETVVALHEYLGRTPSRLLGLALTDAVGDRRTQNQPGTTDEYPNWRVPLSGPDGRPMLLEEVFTDRRAARLAETLRAHTAAEPSC